MTCCNRVHLTKGRCQLEIFHAGSCRYENPELEIKPSIQEQLDKLRENHPEIFEKKESGPK